MEDSRFRPEDEDNQDAVVTPKKRRGRDFLSQYLLRRQETANSDSLDDVESDDEDEEEATGAPKRWRRFFRGAFKNVVPPPETPRNEREHGFDPNTWFSWQSAARSEEQQPDPENTLSKQSASPEVSEDPQIESTEEQRPEEAVNNSEPTRTIPEAALQNIHEGRLDNEAQPGGVIHERLQPSNVVEREVIIERGVGASLPVALVGMEYLARKSADKKLKRSFTKEVDSLKMRASQSETTRNELDAIVRQNREQLEALKRDRGMVEKRSTSKEIRTNSPEKLIQPKTSEQRSKPMEYAPRTEKQSEVQPRMIFESVATAAEQDVPVERVFERSHEIKDDKAATAAAAASIGTIMASQAEIQKIAAVLPTTQANAAGQLPGKIDQSLVAAYDQAIKMGFIAAVSIIVLGTVAYLMVK